MGILSLLVKEPLSFLVLFIPLLYSVIAHEMAHGIAALCFGDDTAKRSGRLSLNPLVHIDPVGLIALFLIGFGWAKPVPVDYRKLKGSRIALIVVSVAGCFVNIVIAAAAIVGLKNFSGSLSKLSGMVLITIIRINLILGSFNLLPIPPLDGSKILLGILPAKAGQQFFKLEPYGLPLLIVLIFTGALSPVINFVQNILFGLIKIATGA